MSQFYSLITDYGEQIIANAVVNKTPIPLKTMAVGDGGGSPITPNAKQTALTREVYRANITDLLQDSQNPNQIIAELCVPENIGGFTVREVGIFDDKDKLVAIANCPENYKPVLEEGSGKVQYYRIVLKVSTSDSVTLSLQNNIVYATRAELNQFVVNLEQADGFKYIGAAESIEQLRSIEPETDGQRILLKSYHAGKNMGGGVFYADFSDNSNYDDGGTVVVTQNGKRWKRVFSTPQVKVPNIQTATNHVFSLSRIGTGKGNVVQSVVIDDRNREMFSHHVYGDDGVSYINRYRYFYGKTIKTAESVMFGANIIGHQGLGIEHQENSAPMLWSSAGKSIANYGLKAVRFAYVENSDLANYQTYQLFDDDFKNKGSTTPTISYDQRYLIAAGYLKSTGIRVVRVFDLQKLIAGGDGDYSNDYLYQWQIDSRTLQTGFYYLQAMACDGETVSALIGYHQVDVPKTICVYSLDGQLLVENHNYTIGKEKSLTDGDGQHYEPESLFFAQDLCGNVKLHHSISSGNAGARVVRVYNDSVNTLQLKPQENEVGLYINGSHDIGIYQGDVLSISEIDSEQNIVDFFKVSNGRIIAVTRKGEFCITTQVNDDRHFVEIRANKNLANGAGINMYANSDKTPNQINFYSGGSNSKTLILNENNLMWNGVIPEKDNSNQLASTKWVNSQYSQNLKNKGWTRLPNGLLLQWGNYNEGNETTFNYPVAFNEIFTVYCTDENITGNSVGFLTVIEKTNTSFSVKTNGISVGRFSMFAIGR